MKNELRQLILFTASYPNAQGETFVENEIHILEKYFERIIVICAANKQNGVDRYIPQNAEVFVFNENLSVFQKLKGIPFLFKRIFWQEVSFARKNLNINFKLIHFKILYMDLVKGHLLSKFTQNIAKKYTADSTYSYAYWSDYKAVACAFLKKKDKKIKAFSRIHRWDLYFYANMPPYLPLRKFIFTHLDAVFCISQDGKEYLKKELKLPDKKIFLARLGTFNEQAKVRLYIETGTLTIVSCSNIIPVKKVQLIIESLALIKNFKIRWIHFGDGPLKNQLVKLAEMKFNENNISFTFSGAVLNNQIISYYNDQQVDLFINVSESEGVPVSIMEAMSAGIPVIATAVGGTPEIVKHGINGILLPANPTPKEIAEAITSFYNYSFEEKNRFRQNAYNTWEEEFNAEKNYKEFAEKLLSL